MPAMCVCSMEEVQLTPTQLAQRCRYWGWSRRLSGSGRDKKEREKIGQPYNHGLWRKEVVREVEDSSALLEGCRRKMTLCGTFRIKLSNRKLCTP